MRILQIIQKPQLRGAEVFASQLSEHLLKKGHEVRMISLQPGEANLPFSGTLVRLNRPPQKRLTDTAGWKSLAHLIKEFKPEIIQANAGDTLKFAVFSKLMFGWHAPIIFRNANKVSDFITSLPKKIFNRFLIRRVSHVISVSELCRQDFISTYEVPSSMTTMIPVGVNPTAPLAEPPEDLREIFRASRVIAHVASLVPEKNHEGMLRIAERLVFMDPSFVVLIVGEGKRREEIKQMIRERKLEKNVILLGARADAAAIMTNALAVILPSRIEGLPGVLLEAMSMGTPVVAYNVGGISEIIGPGETGWLVPAGDEKAFAEAVNDAANGHTRQQVIAKARSLVARDFSNADIAERFLTVYRKVSTQTASPHT